MSTLTIPAQEHGQIRVFAVSRPIPDVSRALKSRTAEDLATELLGHKVAAGTVELFPISDLNGVGLPGYLQQGHYIPEAQLAPVRARLDPLDGYVLLVFSRAFGGAKTTLRTSPDLTLISTFTETAPDNTVEQIDSAASQPYTGIPTMNPPQPNKSRAGSAMVVLGIATALVLLIVWMVR